MTSPASTSCPSSPYPFCVWGLGARGGRGRSGYSRCDCHFLHLDLGSSSLHCPLLLHFDPLHHAAPFCPCTCLGCQLNQMAAASGGEEEASDGEEAASDGEEAEE